MKFSIHVLNVIITVMTNGMGTEEFLARGWEKLQL